MSPAHLCIDSPALTHAHVCCLQVALDDGTLAFSRISTVAYSELTGRHEFVQLRTASAKV